MTLVIYSLDESKQWNAALNEMAVCDIYYTPEYLAAQEQIEEGEAWLAVWDGGALGRVAYAFLKRRIPGQQGLFDLTTPYGYGGPVHSGERDKTGTALAAFRQEFDHYCREQGVVSEFVRFHPLFENHFESDGLQVQYVRDTVVIELRDGNDPMQSFPSKTRNMIRKAQKSEVTIEVTSGSGNCRNFIRLYTQTMQRREAANFYYFPDRFFESLLDGLVPKPVLLTAWCEGKAIAAAMFLLYKRYLHYHFSGSDPVYLHLAPNDLIIYEASKIGAMSGAQFLHLGGGYSTPEDSLFKFKASFSPLRGHFFVGRKIHDPGTYERLTAISGPGTPGFFPAYRSRRDGVA